MQHYLIIIQIATVIFYLDMKYNTSSSTIFLADSNESYTSYYSIDVVSNTILTLTTVSEEEKIKIWKASEIQMEILNYFPNMEIMKEVFQDRVIDKGQFKKSFFNYMDELEGQYFGGELDEEKFKKSFLNPPPNLLQAY